MCFLYDTCHIKTRSCFSVCPSLSLARTHPSKMGNRLSNGSSSNSSSSSSERNALEKATKKPKQQKKRPASVVLTDGELQDVKRLTEETQLLVDAIKTKELRKRLSRQEQQQQQQQHQLLEQEQKECEKQDDDDDDEYVDEQETTTVSVDVCSSSSSSSSSSEFESLENDCQQVQQQTQQQQQCERVVCIDNKEQVDAIKSSLQTWSKFGTLLVGLASLVAFLYLVGLVSLAVLTMSASDNNNNDDEPTITTDSNDKVEQYYCDLLPLVDQFYSTGCVPILSQRLVDASSNNNSSSSKDLLSVLLKSMEREMRTYDGVCAMDFGIPLCLCMAPMPDEEQPLLLANMNVTGHSQELYMRQERWRDREQPRAHRYERVLVEFYNQHGVYERRRFGIPDSFLVQQLVDVAQGHWK